LQRSFGAGKGFHRQSWSNAESALRRLDEIKDGLQLEFELPGFGIRVLSKQMGIVSGFLRKILTAACGKKVWIGVGCDIHGFGRNISRRTKWKREKPRGFTEVRLEISFGTGDLIVQQGPIRDSAPDVGPRMTANLCTPLFPVPNLRPIHRKSTTQAFYDIVMKFAVQLDRLRSNKQRNWHVEFLRDGT